MGNAISTLLVLLFITVFLLLKTVGAFESDDFSLGFNDYNTRGLNANEREQEKDTLTLHWADEKLV